MGHHRRGRLAAPPDQRLISQHSDYFYKWCGYGEQGAHEVALAALQTPHRILGQCWWHGHGCAMVDWQGAPLIVHRIDKLWPNVMPRWNLSLPAERTVQRMWRDICPRQIDLVLKPCEREADEAQRRAELRARSRQRLLGRLANLPQLRTLTPPKILIIPLGFRTVRLLSFYHFGRMEVLRLNVRFDPKRREKKRNAMNANDLTFGVRD